MGIQQTPEIEILAGQQAQQQKLPHPVTTITVYANDGSCDPSSNVFCALILQSAYDNLRFAVNAAVWAQVAYSKSHGKGERGQAGKASGTGNEETVNKKARYDPKTKKWWVPDQNGKRKDLGPSFQPTPEQLKKAGLALTGAAAAGVSIWQILEAAAAGAAAL